MARFVLNETSYHGKGAIGEIVPEIKARGFNKCFVCSDPDLIKFGVTSKVTDLLEKGGGILIAVYPGHAEGKAEGELIEETLSKLDRKKICVSKFCIINSPTSPFFFLIEK